MIFQFPEEKGRKKKWKEKQRLAADFFVAIFLLVFNYCYEKETKTITYQKQDQFTHNIACSF